MATVSWTGGAGDNNWDTGGNWSGGSKPATGDDVIIADYTATISAGLSQSGVNLASLKVTGGVTIGSETSPLVIGVSGTFLWAGSAPYCRISAGSNPIVRAVIKPRSGGTFYASGGTFTKIEGAKGKVYVDSSAVLTTGIGMGAGWEIGYNATSITTFTLAKGIAQSNRTIASPDVGPGAVLITRLTAGVSTKVITRPGGYFNHQGSGTIAHSEVHVDGKADAADNPYNGFTVTDRTNQEGYKSNFNRETISVAFTNAATTVGYLTE